MDKILVIVVTYNAIKWIDKCLRSITQSSIPLDTFIVDNKSSDETCNYIIKKFPNMKLVENKVNFGFGRANNIGLKYAIDKNYNYVYLLNQDAWIETNTIETLIRIHKAHTEYGTISPIQINAAHNKLDANFEKCCMPLHCPSLINDMLINQLKDIYDVDATMAAHWLISRKCLLKVGLFSPSFPHYGEDNNYQQRVSFFKLKNGICPLVYGVHDRENRLANNKKKIYLNYINIITALSNIQLPLHKSLKQALYLSFILSCDILKMKTLEPMLYIAKLILTFPYILRNRKGAIF